MRVKGIILLLALALLPVVFVSADRRSPSSLGRGNAKYIIWMLVF